jgi:hypothetical protein
MVLAPITLLTLNASMQSPEAPHTICDEIAEFLRRPVSEDEILEAFRSLQMLQLVEVTGGGPHASPNDQWFIATPAGREIVEYQWDVVFPSNRQSDT